MLEIHFEIVENNTFKAKYPIFAFLFKKNANN